MIEVIATCKINLNDEIREIFEQGDDEEIKSLALQFAKGLYFLKNDCDDYEDFVEELFLIIKDGVADE